MDILNLFPVPVGQAELERSLTEDEMNCIHEMETRTETNPSHNRFSENQYVLNEEPLKELKYELESFVRKYFDHVWAPKSDDIHIYITTSWLTWTKNNQHHNVHSHPNSLISGTFYVSANDEDSIIFPNDRPKVSNIDIEFDEDKVNIFNCSQFVEPVRTNQIKLFPSSLKHGVLLKENDSPRICLAFNTWIKGTIGSQISSTELKL